MITYKFKGAASALNAIERTLPFHRALGAGSREATVRVAIDSGLVSARSHFKPVKAPPPVLYGV